MPSRQPDRRFSSSIPVAWTGDVPDRLVAQAQQVLGEHPADLSLLDVDDGLPGDARDPAGAGDHRQPAQLRGVQFDKVGRNLEDDTLNAPRQQAVDALSHARRREIGHRRQRQRVAPMSGRLLEA